MGLQISDDYFNNLQYPVNKTKGSVLKSYPALEMIPGFSLYEGEDIDKFIKYIIYMYDKSSPVRTMIKNMDEAKKFSAQKAGYDLKKDAIRLDELFLLVAHQDQYAVTQYLIHQNDRIWSTIVANEETYYEYISKLLDPVSSEKDKETLQALQVKSKLMEDLDAINARLEKYYDKMTGGQEDLAEMLKDRRVSPERIADSVQ